VIVGKRHLRGGRAQAIVCNSGIANVATGERGLDDAEQTCRLLAGHLGLSDPALVLPCSTGVIGHFLPMSKLRRGMAALAGRLARGVRADAEAARAILTTDLVPKTASRRVRLGPGGHSRWVRLAGMAKGSGMIAPNLATMLAFITTDAAIAAPLLGRALKQATAASFNRISVDQDTSTSDSVLVLASAAAGNRPIKAAGRDLDAFTRALTDLCQDLAYQVVKDGEGASKVFRVKVRSAASLADADRVGRTVVGSPLVKTAVHGGDPNWGRLIMAVGRSGAKLDPRKLTLRIGGICVFRQGAAVRLTTTLERKLVRLMQGAEIVFSIDLGLGKAEAEWLGCDLSRQYIAINADYTT
jgi:glutamate N-acetyltransferase/amino-acid N-acetyltransferase